MKPTPEIAEQDDRFCIDNHIIEHCSVCRKELAQGEGRYRKNEDVTCVQCYRHTYPTLVPNNASRLFGAS